MIYIYIIICILGGGWEIIKKKDGGVKTELEFFYKK